MPLQFEGLIASAESTVYAPHKSCGSQFGGLSSKTGVLLIVVKHPSSATVVAVPLQRYGSTR
jgi:hypothetical protein